jgi:hypothetical protein
VAPDQVRCQVSGQSRPLSFRGRYAQVGAVRPGETATLTFPIGERTDKVSIEKREYTLTRKGNEVVHIDPQGGPYPLYQRGHYRASQARLKKVTRFVASRPLVW